jgi:hypothetical protein
LKGPLGDLQIPRASADVRFVPDARLRKQFDAVRKIFKHRRMRFDIARPPKPWPYHPGQIERADPKRTCDGAHEHRAIGRKPGQPARVERLSRARLVAFVQFPRGGIKTGQRIRIICLRAMRPGDPKTRGIRRD